MSGLVALFLCLVGMFVLAIRRAPQWIWALAVLAVTLILQVGLLKGHVDAPSFGLLGLLGWLPVLVFGALSVPPLRRRVLVAPIFHLIRRALPRVSDTVRQTLNGGSVGFESELFGGKPDWEKLRTVPPITLTEEERAFLDGPTEDLCQMINDWQIRHTREIPKEIWSYVKSRGFLGIVIAKKYGGLGFSAQALSLILGKVASRSPDVFSIIMIPNSLGVGELIEAYGTDEQRNHCLPRLAKGQEIPCLR
jgi:acyl-CoA dehydrogenase